MGANSESSSDDGTSTISEVEKDKEKNPNPKIEPEQEEGDVIQSKDPKVRESIIWKVEVAKKHFFHGLQPTWNIPTKMPIAEEHHIVITVIYEYPNLERRFNKYELACLGKPPSSYYPNMV